MDILGNPKMRHLVTDYYEESGEPRLVVKAVAKAAAKENSYLEHVTNDTSLLPAVSKIR